MKEQRPKVVVANLPTEPIVDNKKSEKSDEVMRLYAVKTSAIKEIGGRKFYDPNFLIPLIDYGDPVPKGYEPCIALAEEHGFKLFTDGKVDLYMHGRDAPMFEVSTSQEATFHPQFFALLARKKSALVKIQAPLKWHRGLGIVRVPVDPEITLIWMPELRKM